MWRTTNQTRGRRSGPAGFTLVEILIVVIILGILAAIVMAAMAVKGRDAEAAAFAANLKHYARAYRLFEEKYGHYPPDAGPSVLPAGMQEFINDGTWAAARPLGGQWKWDLMQNGITADVAIIAPSRANEEMLEIDKILDDGDLTTGCFQKRGNDYIYVIEP